MPKRATVIGVCGHKFFIEGMTDEEFILLKNDVICKKRQGLMIQEILPDKSAEFRELFVSGLCFECQKKFFGC